MGNNREVIEHGPSVGTFHGKPIPGWFKTADGARHVFVGTGDSPFDLEQLAADESVISPGLIYRLEA